MSTNPHAGRTAKTRIRLKIYIMLIIGGALVMSVLGISLFMFKIEDTIYCPGVIVPEHTFEIVGHIDAHV